MPRIQARGCFGWNLLQGEHKRCRSEATTRSLQSANARRQTVIIGFLIYLLAIVRAFYSVMCTFCALTPPYVPSRPLGHALTFYEQFNQSSSIDVYLIDVSLADLQLPIGSICRLRKSARDAKKPLFRQRSRFCAQNAGTRRSTLIADSQGAVMSLPAM